MMLLSDRVSHLTPPMLRNMTLQCEKVGGVNLGQGICQLPVPDSLKEGANSAVNEDHNAYCPAAGIFSLRESIATKIRVFNQFTVNPNDELLISHGATGAYVCAVLALFNPGDEVILLEPFYPLHKMILNFYNVQVKTAKINLTDLSIDIDELKSLISKRTKGLVLCNPCNPCGKVFSADELKSIAELAEHHNLSVISDEIYEYITYPGHKHLSIATFFDSLSRVITISGFSKTFSMTGWRMGYASGPAHVIHKMVLIQDLLYVCPVTPLQHALVNAYNLPDIYFSRMRDDYFMKLNFVCDTLKAVGIKPVVPQGAYYILANCDQISLADGESAADFMLSKAKVGTVPGEVFFEDASHKKSYLRLCFAHEMPVLEQALTQIKACLNHGA